MVQRSVPLLVEEVEFLGKVTLVHLPDVLDVVAAGCLQNVLLLRLQIEVVSLVPWTQFKFDGFFFRTELFSSHQIFL